MNWSKDRDAEIQRLKAEVGNREGEKQEMREVIYRLKAENERYRGALEEIAKSCPIIMAAEDPDCEDVLWQSTKRRRTLARQVLKSAAKE